MQNSSINRVIILGVIALMGAVSMQAYYVISTWDINEDEFRKKVNLALYNVAKELAELNDAELPTREVINQRTNNYYIVNVEYEIDKANLEYFLQKHLEALAVNIDFEYAVFNCNTNNMEYGGYCSYEPGREIKTVETDLPEDNKFVYYFGVRFPTRSGYLLGKMQLNIFLAGVLLLVVLFFGYSMSVILRQRRLSNMQKDFINNMTHEFKTPISTIKISTDVFLNNAVIRENDRLFQYANIIQQQNQRLNHQVEKVLQLAKIEDHNFDLKRETVVLNEVLNNIVESTRLRVEEMNGQFEANIPEDSISIFADPLHLTNILHNLIDNAIKYCKAQPDIRIDLQMVNKRKLIFVIKDHGIGIKKEFQAKIFDKFYRVPTGDIHDVKGFGLGLFYVKSVCDSHGWKLRLKSEEEKGTTVYIHIPIQSINPKK